MVASKKHWNMQKNTLVDANMNDKQQAVDKYRKHLEEAAKATGRVLPIDLLIAAYEDGYADGYDYCLSDIHLD